MDNESHFCSINGGGIITRTFLNHPSGRALSQRKILEGKTEVLSTSTPS